ncbi:MAG: hypothetical protein ABIH23_10125 [bacterium]
MKPLELTVEEKMQLRDLVTSDVWKVIKRIQANVRENGIEHLIGTDEGKSFHRAQGCIIGMDLFVQQIESLSMPPKTFDGPDTTEYNLRAR